VSRRARSNSRGAGRVWASVGTILGAIAVSGALIAVLHQRDQGNDGDRPAGATDETGPPKATGRQHWQHEFPDGYAGPVWITVDPPDDLPRTITITWGPWQRQLLHDGNEPGTYLFAKSPTAPGEATVPTSVDVDPAAVVTFGQGKSPPRDAVDVNEGWIRVAD
jgi:hypothetical protein